MRIISFIEDEEVIEKILKHLGLWDLKVRPPPNVKVSSVTISIDYSDSHVPFSGPSFYPEPDYPDGFVQDFKTERVDSDGCGFCYRSSVFMQLKMFRYDIHIFSWHQCKLSLGNLQLLRHLIAEDL
jgi:hypothetical protein